MDQYYIYVIFLTRQLILLKFNMDVLAEQDKNGAANPGHLPYPGFEIY
jgi:hypothetical protein